MIPLMLNNEDEEGPYKDDYDYDNGDGELTTPRMDF